MTTQASRFAKRFMTGLALTGLAACSGGRGDRPQAAPPVVYTAAQIDTIQALLNDGNVKEAEKLLRALLKRSPMDSSARVLLDSIERDPKDLLGPTSYPYTVRPGETMTLLAERLLGNRLKAYQLARYNGIAIPSTLSAGQVIRIPGTAPRPAPPPRSDAPNRPSPSPSSPAASKPRPAPAPAPTKPAANPAAARQARAAGLAQLNQGNVNRAVALLRRAAVLDPGNPVIARDLQRAERIAATVRARR